METIPQATLEEIVRTNGRDMYRHEFVQMARELRDLRDRFNKREDLRGAADVYGVLQSEGDLARWALGLRARLDALRIGDTIKLPDPYRRVEYIIRKAPY